MASYNPMVNLLRKEQKPMTSRQMAAICAGTNCGNSWLHMQTDIIAMLLLGEIEGVLERYGLGGDDGTEMMWRAK